MLEPDDVQGLEKGSKRDVANSRGKKGSRLLGCCMMARHILFFMELIAGNID